MEETDECLCYIENLKGKEGTKGDDSETTNGDIK